MTAKVRTYPLDRSRQAAVQIHEILRSRILSVDLVPGTTLSRAALQMEFGVSQTPVRDALMRLEEEDLIDVYPQHATVVARIDSRHARQAQFLRMAVELEAIQRVTDATPRETAQRLATVLRQQEAVADPATYDAFDEFDRQFHHVLYEDAGVPELWSVTRRQSVHLDRLRRLNLPMPGKMQDVLTAHQNIVRSVGSGDVLSATQALRQHLSGTLALIDVISAKYPDYIEL